VTQDPRVHDHAWAAELGLVSFAGYQLRPPGGETSGVLALFAAHPISAEEDALLEMLSHTTAQVIRQSRAEADLRRFREALDNAADAVFLIDRDEMRFIDVNDTACSSMGYTRDELLKMGPHDLKPDFTREILAMVFDGIIRHESCGRIETVHQRKDGTTFPVEVVLRSMSDDARRLLVASVRDTSQRKEAEEALRASEEKYSRLVNNLSIGVAQISADMKVLSMNRQMTQWFPASGTTGVDAPCHQVFGLNADSAECKTCPAARALRDGEPHEEIIEREDPEGKRHFRVLATPIRDDEGNITSAIKVMEDVTELKNAEARLKQTFNDLERFNRMAVGRELRMIELKREVNRMADAAHLEPPYDLDFTASEPGVANLD
jgi:PAS domain S-box-containing protein